MPNLTHASKFDQYNGEDKFIFCDIIYEEKVLLGEGTTASVFRFDSVNSASLTKSVAVKVEHPANHRGLERFEEGETFFFDAYWNQQIYGLGVLSGDPRNVMKAHYVLMPYFAGILASKISLHNARELVEWFIMLASFIHEKMHLEKNAIHGDIKMDNVIFQASEKKVCVIDFGLTERIGNKIGQYFVPEIMDPVLKVIKKLTPVEYCPQTAPELFGKEQIPAEPSQDAYGLGYFISSLLSKASNISNEQMAKLRFVIGHLRAALPQERWSIPTAISKLHADFIAVVPRPISNGVESTLKKLGLFRQRRVVPHQDVNPRVIDRNASLPLLTKAMANKQLQLAGHHVGLCDELKESDVLKLPPVLSAGAAPAASSSEENNGASRAAGEKSGSKCIEAPWHYLFALHGMPKQDDPHAKPAQGADRRL